MSKKMSSPIEVEHHILFDLTALKPAPFKRTNVICTIGPASRDPKTLLEMIKRGMTIARLNFSHGDHEYHAETIKNVREAVAMYRKEIETPEFQLAIALDTKGPEIRTGIVPNNGEIDLAPGSKVTVSTKDSHKENPSSSVIYVDYQNLSKVVKPGNQIYIEDGLMCLDVDKVEGDQVHCTVNKGGKLGTKKGVNLPGVPVDLPSISEKDKGDLKFGCEQGVDMIFASFIREGKAVKEIREFLAQNGGKEIRIYSKIENHQGILDIDSIIRESDGIMVARGDMGIEVNRKFVPLVQKMITAKCNIAGKPSITATQMLESMITRPIPTRAEDSDVANAVFDGADSVMLSGESAKGKWPVEAVHEQSQSCLYAEAALINKFQWIKQRIDHNGKGVNEAISIAEKVLNSNGSIKGIITLCSDGQLTRRLSQLKPRVPIIAVCPNTFVLRFLYLFSGVVHLLRDPKKSDAPEFAAKFAGRAKIAEKGGKLLVVNEEDGSTNEIDF